MLSATAPLLPELEPPELLLEELLLELPPLLELLLEELLPPLELLEPELLPDEPPLEELAPPAPPPEPPEHAPSRPMRLTSTIGFNTLRMAMLLIRRLS